ncbi:MAG: hypothetical protein ACOCXT_06040, partial [Candidatus Dojkabacteria bacterium]
MESNKKNPKSKTVLLFPYTHQLGTTHSLVAVADVLKQRGYDVLFACAKGRYNDYIKSAGHEIVPIMDVDSDLYKTHLNRSSLGFHTLESIECFVEAETKLIEKYKPVFVLDMIRLTLKLSAHLTNTPRATLIYTILTDYYNGERSIPESHWLHAFIRNPVSSGLAQKLTPYAVEYFFQKWTKPYNKFLKDKSTLRIKSMRQLYEGDLTFLIDSSKFAPHTPLPPNVTVTGPVLHTNDQYPQEWLQTLDPSKKIIF